jgi:diguanylate cyclase (GGDEF)-like protein
VTDDAEGALEVAERIREAVRRDCVPSTGDPLERPITVSLGVVSLSEETWSMERLVAMADAEMYRSKKTGKDRVSVFQSA